MSRWIEPLSGHGQDFLCRLSTQFDGLARKNYFLFCRLKSFLAHLLQKNKETKVSYLYLTLKSGDKVPSSPSDRLPLATMLFIGIYAQFEQYSPIIILKSFLTKK